LTGFQRWASAADLAMLPDSRALRSARVSFSPDLPFARRPLKRVSAPNALDLGQRWQLELFPDETFQLDLQRVEVTPDGVTTWIARMPDDEVGEAIISQRGNEVFGAIRRNHRVYHLRSAAGGRYFAEELDAAAFPQHEDDAVHGQPHAKHGVHASAGVKAQGPGESRTIDVAVLYTQAVAARQDVALFINNAAAEMNQSFINSGVDASVRVVYYGLSAYVEPTTMHWNPHFRDLPAQMAAGSGPFSGLPDLRNAVRADVVALITNAANAGNTCGGGHVPEDPLGSPNNAYSAFGDTCVTTMRNFTHEIGHNLGAFHDKALGVWPYAPYGYSYGFSSETPGFRTIMGSRFGCTMDQGCSRINYWSNPNLMHQGTAMGSASDANLALSHNNWITIPAAYRTSGDPAPGQPASVTVHRDLCYGSNVVDWSAGSGTVGWYEIQTATQSNFGNASEAYRGPVGSLILDVGTTTYVRGRACNAEGCSSWKQSPMTAIYVNYCL
jgi:peptidyl-Asp metalloendopeptidase